MWVALFIIGLYTWIVKRRKKSSKNTVILLWVFLIVLATPELCKAQGNKITISGQVILTKQELVGEIIIFLVDETAFKTPLTGIDTVIIKPTGKIVSFTFKPQKKGVYGIRCFHDLNNNGKLDKKGFFPSEPYGFSWKSGKKFPFGYSDISFTANTNKFFTIKMED